MLPVIEILDANGTRHQTCGYYGVLPGQVNNLPCVNRLPGIQYLSSNYYAFRKVLRISDERSDARPDFIYTFGIHNCGLIDSEIGLPFHGADGTGL